VPPIKRSTVGGRAFPVAGPKTWNALPEDVTSSQSEYTSLSPSAQNVAFQEVFSGHHHHLILTAS